MSLERWYRELLFRADDLGIDPDAPPTPPIGPVKPSTLKLADDLMAEKCRLDEIWRKDRKKLHEEWLENRPTLTLAEYVNQVCEQVRRGK